MTLYIKPISALLTHDTQIFSNMDPYVVIKIGTEKKKSRTHKEGGKKPKWDEVFKFKPSLSTKSMEVIVMDEDTVTDDHVGSAKVDLSKFLNSPGEHKQYISLTYKNRSAGKIYLSIRYEPVNQQPSNFGNGMGANNGNSLGWGQQQPSQPINPVQPMQLPQSYNQSYQQGPMHQPYQQSPGMSQPGYNSGWNQNPPNSGWGQVPPSQMSNNQEAMLANNLLGGMGIQQPQQPQQGYSGQQSGSDVMGLLGNILTTNTNSVGQNNPQNNASEWGNNPNSGNSGWGPNNNGWGASNGSGW